MATHQNRRISIYEYVDMNETPPLHRLDELDIFDQGGLVATCGCLWDLFFRPKTFHAAEDALGRAERIAASSTLVFALTLVTLPFHYLAYYLADAWHYVRWPTFEVAYPLHVVIIVLVPSFVIYVVTMFFATFLRPSLVVGLWFVAAGFNLWLLLLGHGFSTPNAARFFLALHVTLYFLGGFLVGCLRVAPAEIMTILPVAMASMGCLAESNPLITDTFGWPASTMGWLHVCVFTLGFARPCHMAIHPLWVLPRPRGRWYRRHPVAWDHIVHGHGIRGWPGCWWTSTVTSRKRPSRRWRAWRRNAPFTTPPPAAPDRRSTRRPRRTRSPSFPESKTQGVHPYVFRPIGDPVLEPRPVVGEEGAGRLLVARQITRDRVHEFVRRFLGSTAGTARIVAPPGRVDQLAQGGRGAAGLGRQPFPLPGQQRHLPRNHPELGPPPAARRGFRLRDRFGSRAEASDRFGKRRRQPFDDLRLRTAQVQIHHPAGGIVEDQNGGRGVVLHRRPHDERHLGQGAGAHASVAGKGGARGCRMVGHGFSPGEILPLSTGLEIPRQYHPDNKVHPWAGPRDTAGVGGAPVI